MEGGPKLGLAWEMQSGIVFYAATLEQALTHLTRQAQELGLHRHTEFHHPEGDNIEETLSLIWYDEYKRRVWLNLFVWDR